MGSDERGLVAWKAEKAGVEAVAWAGTVLSGVVADRRARWHARLVFPVDGTLSGSDGTLVVCPTSPS